MIGDKTNDYKEVARREKLSDLQVRVRQLIDQVDQIRKEQDYQRVWESADRPQVVYNTLQVHAFLNLGWEWKRVLGGNLH